MRCCSQSNDCQAHTAYFCGQMHTGRVMSRKCCAFYFLIPWAAEIFSFEVRQGHKCDITLQFSHALKIWVHSMSTKMTRACCEIPIFALAQDERIKDPHQKRVHQQLLFWNPSLSPFGHVYSLIKLTVAVIEWAIPSHPSMLWNAKYKDRSAFTCPCMSHYMCNHVRGN